MSSGSKILDAISKLSDKVDRQQHRCSACSGLLIQDLDGRTGVLADTSAGNASPVSLPFPIPGSDNGLFAGRPSPVGPFGHILQPVFRPQGMETILRWKSLTPVDTPFFTGEGWPSEQTTALPNTRFAELTRLVEKYRQVVHSKNPILDMDEVHNMMLNLAEHGFDWSLATCLSALICAIGALSQRYQAQRLSLGNQSTPDALQPLSVDDYLCGSEPQLSLQFWHVAVKRLGSAAGHDGLQGAQCLCLAGIYYMHLLEPLQAWKYFNLAGSVWYSWHLTEYASGRRSSPRLPEQSVTVAQALFFTIWKSICELRLEIDVPGFFDNVGLPYEFPLAPDLGEVETGGVYLDEDAKHWFYYLSDIAARHQINRIASSMSCIPTVPTTQDVQRMLALADMFEATLNDWHASLPPILRFDIPVGCRMEFHMNDDIQILRHRYLTCKELINRPFVRLCVETTLPNNEPYRASVLQRASVCLQYCMLKLSQVAPHRHQGTWFGLRNAATSIFILCSVSFAHESDSSSLHLSLPHGWEDLAARALDILSPLLSYSSGGASNIGQLVRSTLARVTTA